MRCRLLLIVLLLGACAGEPDAPQAEIPPVRIQQQRGPVSVIVEAEYERVTAGERFTLTIEAIAEDGVAVRLPEHESVIGEFEVHDANTPIDVPLEQGGRRWRDTYVLSTFETGALELPAMTIAFTDTRGETPIDGEIVTDVMPITVSSFDVDPANLRDIKAAVDLPDPPLPIWGRALIAVGVVVLAVLIGVLHLSRRRLTVVPAPPPVPAHVWAFARLDELEADDLVDRGDLHGFFFRLSDIVRQYLERRFDMSAPERTTEEFIREVRHDPRLSAEQQGTLREFLRAADMVKFALHRPPQEHCRAALGTARSFVEQTSVSAAAPVRALQEVGA